MARLSVKYPIGSKVQTGDVEGLITTIFIRGLGRAYEFSYIDNNGHPTSCNVEEVEIRLSDKIQSLGFQKKEQK